MLRVVLVAALLGAPGCNFLGYAPNPSPDPTPAPLAADAGSPAPSVTPVQPTSQEADSGASRGDVYVKACAHLAELGCSTGKDPKCAELMRQADRERLTDVDEACFLRAKNVAGAKACGFVRCSR